MNHLYSLIMNNKRNVVLFLTFVFSFVLYFIQDFKEIVPLDQNDPSLSESMQNYYHTEAIAEAKGEHFQAKLISCVEVVFDDPSYDTSYSFYRYQVLIAPLNDERMAFQDMIISVDESLEEYYSHRYGGRNSLAESQFYLSRLDYPVKTTKEELVAYRGDFTISNMGDDIQSQWNIEEDVFDEAMKTLRLVIQFNHTSEIIELKLEDEIPAIDSEDKALLSREDLHDLYHDGGAGSFFAPYDDEFLIDE